MRANWLGWLALAVLVAIVGHRLADFTGVRNTTFDELGMGLYGYGSGPLHTIHEFARKMAVEQGRVYFQVPGSMIYTGIWQNHLPPGPLYDALSLGSLLLSSLLAAYAIGRYWAPAPAWLYLLVFWALLPQLWNHTPPGAHGATPFIPMMLAFLAVVALWRYGASRRWPWLALALLSYGLSLISHEMFLLLSTGLFAGALWHVHRTRGWTRRRALAVAAAAAVLLALYVAAYVAWRLQHPTSYEGNRLALANTGAMVKTFLRYLVGGTIFPYWHHSYQVGHYDAVLDSLRLLARTDDLGDLLRQAAWADWVTGILGGVLAGALCWRFRERLGRQLFLGMLLAGGWVGSTAVVLYAINEKYQQWVTVHGDTAYQGSRYAYFGLLLAGVAVLVAGLRATQGRRPAQAALACVLGVFVAVGAVSTSGFNSAVARTLRIHSGKWWAFHDLIECEALAAHLPGHRIFAPRLWDHSGYGGIVDPYWNSYYRTRANQSAQFFRKWPQDAPPERMQLDYRLSDQGEVLAVLLLTRPDGTAPRRLYALNPRGGMLTLEPPEGAALGHPEQTHTCGGTLETYPVQGDLTSLADLSVTHSEAPVLTWQSSQGKGIAYAFAAGRGPELDFSMRGEGDRYVRQGWFSPESWGLWSDGPRAELRLKLVDVPDGDLELVANAHALVPGAPLKQEVTVVANDVEIGHWQFTASHATKLYRATIPARAIAGRPWLHLTFQIAHPTSPQSLGISNDGRQLGLGLVSLQLRAAPGAGAR